MALNNINFVMIYITHSLNCFHIVGTLLIDYRLFEEAALKLNLESLMSFVKDLCAVSHQQLFSRISTSEIYNKQWWKLRNIGKAPFNAESDHSLFLSRINQVMLKCIRSGRPLLHIMKIWSLVGPHYIEVDIRVLTLTLNLSILVLREKLTIFYRLLVTKNKPFQRYR